MFIVFIVFLLIVKEVKIKAFCGPQCWAWGQGARSSPTVLLPLRGVPQTLPQCPRVQPPPDTRKHPPLFSNTEIHDENGPGARHCPRPRVSVDQAWRSTALGLGHYLQPREGEPGAGDDSLGSARHRAPRPPGSNPPLPRAQEAWLPAHPEKGIWRFPWGQGPGRPGPPVDGWWVQEMVKILHPFRIRLRRKLRFFFPPSRRGKS